MTLLTVTVRPPLASLWLSPQGVHWWNFRSWNRWENELHQVKCWRNSPGAYNFGPTRKGSYLLLCLMESRAVKKSCRRNYHQVTFALFITPRVQLLWKKKQLHELNANCRWLSCADLPEQSVSEWLIYLCAVSIWSRQTGMSWPLWAISWHKRFVFSVRKVTC